MPEIGDHDEVIPPGDIYLDDILALGQGIPHHWSEKRIGHADIFAFIETVVPGVAYHLIIQCCLAAPAIGGRPTHVRTALFGAWGPIDNLIVPSNNLLYRAHNQTVHCRHVYGPPELDMPVVLAGEYIWVPLSEILACVFRNPPAIR
jgi:hypothetical protein